MVSPDGLQRLATSRKCFLDKFERIAHNEVDKEETLHAEMPGRVASILTGKRLRILDMMMKDA
eukprot:5799026-Amphidinium_carterae.1